MNHKIPYKIYLSEDEIPKTWYNLRADMKNKPAPLLNPATLKPLTAEELALMQNVKAAVKKTPDDAPVINFYKVDEITVIKTKKNKNKPKEEIPEEIKELND